ncbi:MAG: hypothetical protein HOP11_14785, partial [Saprospiraceae bacterium]|nr:hypothetical protein [Saprospiraceae bacterium]
MKTINLNLSAALLILICSFLQLNTIQSQCVCNNNQVSNGNFNVNTSGWTAYNGDLTVSNPYPQCGTPLHAQFRYDIGTFGGFYQDLFSFSPGQLLDLKFWAGVHNSSPNAQFGFEFYNGTTLISSKTLQVDFILGSSGSGMQYYTILAFVPATTNKVRITGFCNGDFLKVDEVCLNLTACDPNDPTAGSGFCTQQTNCPVGNFLWKQEVDPNDGSTPLRLVCGSTTTFLIPGPYGTALSSGQPVNINSISYVSYDGYVGRNSATQQNERWRLIFKKSSITVATTPYTTDINDLVNQNTKTGTLGTYMLPAGADQIFIEHWAVANDGTCSNGPNSVAPISVCINATTINPCVNVTSFAQSELNLVKTRTISDEILGCVTGPNRVMYIECLLDNLPGGTTGNRKYWKIVSGGTFKEYCDGTAYATMLVQNVDLPSYQFNVALHLTGRTYSPPAGSPKIAGCVTSAQPNWYYYTGMKGSLIGVNSLSGAVLSFTRSGESFQLGTDASLFGQPGNFGASGWFSPTILMQPGGLQLVPPCADADFNFFLSGGDLTSTQASVCGKVCPGAAVVLNGYGTGGKEPYTYNWQTLGLGQNKTVNPTTTTTYTLSITDAQNCVSVDQVTINVNTPITVTFTGNTTICAGNSTTLTANASGGTPPYASYTWSGGLGTGQTKTVSPIIPTTYTVTVVDALGCIGTGQVLVTVNAKPVASASNNGPLTCVKSSVTLTALPATGVSYLWSNGATSQTTNVTTQGIYTVTVTNTGTGCTATASTTVTENKPAPNPSASNNGPITCTKPVVTLTALPSGMLYMWSNGANSQITTTSTAGTYTVTVTDPANGCTASAQTVVSSNTTPPVASASNDGPITCVKPTSTLTALPATGVTYLWSNGATGQTTVVSSQGTYTVTVTSMTNGCTASAQTIVTQNKPVPNASITHNGPLTCVKTSVTLTATPNSGVSWFWSTGSTSQSITTSTPGTFTVTVTELGNGCTASATATITQDITPPVPGASNNGPLTCTKTSVNLTATPTTGVTYLWSNGSTSQIASTSTPGTYTVTVTNMSNGCTASAQTVVSQNITPPVPSASNNGPLTCTKLTVNLTALPTTGVTYSWSNGSTSQITTTSNPGTYTVTVTNISNGCTASAQTVVTQNIPVPDATATATPPVSCVGTTVNVSATPTTGVFYLWNTGSTAQNFNTTTAGTYTVTVTEIENGCTKSAQATVTVNTINPGSVGSDQTICSGGDPIAFTSVNATGSGAITYQWQSNTTGCAGTFTNIPGATSATYDIPSGLTITTYYRRVATSTLSGVQCSGNSNCLTITINNVTAGSISADQTICSGGDPLAFNNVTSATGSGTITYQWQSSTTGCAGTFTNISGATSATYDVPSGLTVTTSYRRVATSTQNGVPCSANSNCITVTVNDINPGSIAADQTICSGGNPNAFTSVAATGFGTITYQWQSSTTGCAGSFSDIVGATSATYDVLAGLTVTTSYRRVATSTQNGVPCSANSNCITVTVNDINPGSIAADQTICSGGNPNAFTSVAATGSGAITYQWQSSTTGCAGSFSNIVGATSATYDVPAGLTVTTSYRRVATSTQNSVPCSANSNCITVTVNDLNPGSIAADQTICSGGNPNAFTSVAATGSGAITYQWQSSITGCAGSFTDIVGATSATYDVPAGLTVTTSYRRVATSTQNGVPCSANSNCITVTVNDINPGSIASDQTICNGGNPNAFTSVAATGSGAITYQWQSSTTGCAGSFVDIAGATSATYDVPAGLTVTTSYRRVATSTLNGVLCSANSNCITVTINNINPGSVASDQTICSGGNPNTFTSVAATGSGAITYQWQSSTTGCAGSFTDIVGATSATYDVPAGLTVTTSYRRVATSTQNSVPCSA